MAKENWNRVPGTPTSYTCPACAGAIQEFADTDLRRYRCRVGHAYSAQDWLGEKARRWS